MGGYGPRGEYNSDGLSGYAGSSDAISMSGYENQGRTMEPGTVYL